jgi:tetratricopeptide (TPR) repeat protein
MASEDISTPTLSPALFENVRQCCTIATDQMNESRFEEAQTLLDEAYRLLPEPKIQWNAAGWILLALAENAVRAQNYPEAVAALQDAVYAPGTIGNPWVHLRFGQAALETRDEQRAGNELIRAFMGGGREIFSQVDPKYFRFLQSVAKPPQGGW